MKLITKHFGEIEVNDDIVITFDETIPGFPDSKRYILIRDTQENIKEDGELFFWLQSIDQPEIALVMMDVLRVMPDYNPLVDKEEIKNLGEFEPEFFFVYNICVIPENIQKLSVNLKAPIIINDKLKKGKQVISNNNEYGIRHYIFEELNKKK